MGNSYLNYPENLWDKFCNNSSSFVMMGESSLALVVGQPDVQGLAGTGHLAGLKHH